MRNLTTLKPPVGILFITLLSSLSLFGAVPGQTASEENPAAASQVSAEKSDYVSIQVDGGTIRDVLNAFAIQTKRNVVIGPEVTTEGVSIHLNQVLWDEALEVILKPYGYGYRTVGETIVISKLENIAALAAVEPVENRVYKLRYLDASDVQEIITGHLSPRGSCTIITARGQKGWKNLTNTRGNSRGSGISLEMREREDTDQLRGKTIVVTDVPSVLDSVAKTLEEVDVIPKQVLIEARFMEVNEDVLRDIGVQMGGSFEIGGNPIRINDRFFDDAPNAFGALSDDLNLNGATPSSFGRITGGDQDGSWDLLINMIQEDEDTKTLSSPKVLTLNNQEAAIVVGTRYPIISTETTNQGGDNPTISEELEYYESIGIQLNVVPQICDDGYINMVTRPSVTEIIGFEGENDYPIIKTRDTETQVLVENGETIVIGGLLEDRKTDGVFKVPFIGDIPLLGHLFRRDTKDTKTIDLLIFISASIIDEDNYGTIIPAQEELAFDKQSPEEPQSEPVDVSEAPSDDQKPIPVQPFPEQAAVTEEFNSTEKPGTEEAIPEPATVIEEEQVVDDVATIIAALSE